ncbi:MAG: glycosyltransferase family 2 protein [Campylobacteraceae bacterium]|nr:glycosyltransferase family 2 protein [Campylobacteraceae bacterium]
MIGNCLVSIIVPVYKVEKYLKKCIDSIIDQTYKNLDIILVDDGSPDECPKICDEYALKDTRIRVIHKENGGLSDARNAGLDVANGEWIVFIDSDDFVSGFYIENLYYLVKKYRTNIGVTSYMHVYEDKFYNLKEESIYNKEALVYPPDEAIKNMLYGQKYNVNAWGKIYKKELFDDVRFPKGKNYEDLATMPIIFRMSNLVAFYDKKDYFYFQREDSIIGSSGNNKDFVIFDIYKNLEKYFYKDKEIIKAIKIRKVRDFFMILHKFKNNPNGLEDKINLIRKTLKEDFLLVIKSNKSTTKDKIKILLYKFFGLRFFLFFKDIVAIVKK